MIVPDTAHGTNPASAAMCGFNVISLPSNERGRVNVAEIRKVLGADTAVCMMTNPNTLGLFEDQIAEIAAAVHDAGGLMYYDGANANAHHGLRSSGRHGLRSDASQHAQDVYDSARRGRRGTWTAWRRCAPRRVSTDARRRNATAPPSLSTSIVRSRSARCVPSGRTSRTRCARWHISTPTAKKG